MTNEGSNGRKETGIDMQKKERMANLEVLRCVAMMMVVVLHGIVFHMICALDRKLASHLREIR